MSYSADALAAKLRDAGPGHRFNILSSVLPVRLYWPPVGADPGAADAGILGIPLATVVDEFEQHASKRTPVLTAFSGLAGAAGRDVFGACVGQSISAKGTPDLSFASLAIGTTTAAKPITNWYALDANQYLDRPPGFAIMGSYTRYSRDGFFYAAGHKRLGVAPSASLPNVGDFPNQSPAGMCEIPPGLTTSDFWSVAVPRVSTIAADGSHTYGPNGLSLTQTALQTVAAGQALNRCWTAISCKGIGSAGRANAVTKVEALNATLYAEAAMDISGFGPNTGAHGKAFGFGVRPVISQVGLVSGAWAGSALTFGPTRLSISEVGAFYLGRRALTNVEIQKLYYYPSASLQVFLEPYQNPVRVLGYLDQMSHRQIAKLLDGIAAGTIDPQVATPSAVWDAVR